MLSTRPFSRSSSILALGALALSLASTARGATAATPVAAVATAHGADESASATLRATEEAFAKSFADRDRERFASFVHPNAVFDVNGHAPLRGKAAVMEQWSKYLAGDRAPFSWRPAIAEAHDGVGVTAGPVFDATGKWVGNFSSVWQRQGDGSWKIVFDGEPACEELGKTETAAPSH